MRLPTIAFPVACLPALLQPQAVAAAPMGASSRESVQIVASVAPRIQISGAAQLPGSGSDALCLQSNAPSYSYSVTAVDGSGATMAIPASSSCESGQASSQALLTKLAASAGSADAVTLLIAPE